jgi:hypothetical protein
MSERFWEELNSELRKRNNMKLVSVDAGTSLSIVTDPGINYRYDYLKLAIGKLDGYTVDVPPKVKETYYDNNAKRHSS